MIILPAGFIRALPVIGIVLLSCAGETPVNVPESPAGNITGTVRDKSGAPAAEASVFLIPESYIPLSPEGGEQVDSTICDKLGRFGFSVNKTGTFNLLSKKNNTYVLHRSIYINDTARVILQDQILTTPGSVTGKVQLRGSADHRPVFILVPGINRYTEPVDSTGAFTIGELAPGSYTIRTVPAEANFASVETTITVTSGEATILPVINLPAKYIPQMKNFTVRYDTAMMKAELAWDLLDTSLVSGYTIFLNRPMNPDPVATLGDSCSGMNFDIIMLPFDTFAFQISAIGNDGNPGPSIAVNPFVKQSAAPLLKTMHYTCTYPAKYIQWIIDNDHNIYECLENFTKITDSNGVVVATRLFSEADYGRIYNRRVDESGNLFANTVKTSGDGEMIRSLIRFDRNFTAVARFEFAPEDDPFDYITCGDGMLLAFIQHFNELGKPTSIDAIKLDPFFNIIAETKLTDNWIDTIFVDEASVYSIGPWYLADYLTLGQTSSYLDTIYLAHRKPVSSFNSHPDALLAIENKLSSILSPEVVKFTEINVPADQGLIIDGYTDILFSPCGIISTITSTNDDRYPMLVSIFNTKHQQFARMPLTANERVLQLDSQGNLYIIRQDNFPEAVIYKYSTGRLIQGIVP